ncbi:hypothetical protein SEA_EAGLEPRIDE_44 [Mycobacterium phage Eaglepride]|nr:hypothetical protein SEA_EAGLEPRIDE_44 [Mycobacterium phage Eaglepride]
MEIQLSVAREGKDPLVVTAAIEGLGLIDSPEYREHLFDATIQSMVDAIKAEGFLQ